MNKNTPLTVFIFTYNQEKSIANAIESVVNQKTNYEYKIEICEDCSTDGTLAICKEYAVKYPEKITLYAQKTNTFNNPNNETNHIYQAYDRIQTKYWCYLDGDDCWCNENKIQMGLDILEAHPECSMYGHDSIWNDCVNEKKSSYIHDLANMEIADGVYSPEEAPFILPSARIYRSDFKFHKIVQPIDVYHFYYHLTKGSLYYYDKIMSIYNFSGDGLWSQISDKKRLYFDQTFQFRMCQFLNFEYENLWLKNIMSVEDATKIKNYKKKFGTKLGWYLWFIIKFVPKFGLKILDKNFSLKGHS